MASTVRRTVLPGGLRVVTEAMPSARSATLGLWTKVGSRDESPSLAGATHFLEHLLFKGTKRRTALDISAELDAVGGELNAFTGKEYTCYHARVLDADVPLAIDVLCDMVTSSLMPAHEVESERGVILEEIAMHDDDPDDVIHDAFVAQLYGDTPLGRSITGSVESINALTRRQIHGYYRRRYTADNLVFAAAGNVDHADVVRRVRGCLRAGRCALGRPGATTSPGANEGTASPAPTAGARAARAPDRADELRDGYAGLRPQRPSPVRPRRPSTPRSVAAPRRGCSRKSVSGEVWRTRSTRSPASTSTPATSRWPAGACLTASTTCLAICRDELAKVAASGVTIEELARAKGQIRGGLVMGLEDSSARMSRIGKAEVVPGGVLSIDESLARIDAVTLDDVHAVARDILDAETTLAVLGPAKALARVPR